MTRVDTEDASTTSLCNASRPSWHATIEEYKRPNTLRSAWQVVSTFVPLVSLWCLMYLSSFRSTTVMLLLALPTAGFLVRVFIIQHDCGHHSFFRSRRANNLLGLICGVFTLTPYYYWRRTHSRHHATSGDLDHRGHGDILTWTVDEYAEQSPMWRFLYRVYRNPLFMFVLGASLWFIVLQRFTLGIPRSWRRERFSVHFTNLCLLSILVVAWFTIGLPTFFSIWLPVAMLGAAVGSWLFFVQHQYENAYWQRHESWDFEEAALQGSSFYRLPRIFEWLTASIGYHHIHHLNSRIPNYNLAACHHAEPSLRRCITFGVWESLKCPSLKLWDEDRQQMVGFNAAQPPCD